MCCGVRPQYYDDAAGILRSIILSAIAPHRLSLPTMPMPAFSMTPDQVETSVTVTCLGCEAGTLRATCIRHDVAARMQTCVAPACGGCLALSCSAISRLEDMNCI